MTSETLLQKVSRFAAGVRNGRVEPEILQDARRRTTDIIGIALAASGMEPARIVEGVIEGWGGEEQAGVIGRGERYPAASAALMNGTLAHSLDYDDTHLPSVLHPSAAVVPASLAAAETSGATGRDLLAAIAAGDELVVRVGMAGYDPALGNSIFFEKGLHATSIAGTLGTALAAAMLYGLGEEEISHAVAISTSMGAGIIEANRTGGTIKRIHCGWAAHAGVTAAELAVHGLTGPPTAFEGRFGFLRAYLDDRADAEALTRGKLGGDKDLLQALPREPLHPRRDRRGDNVARGGSRYRGDRRDRAGRRQSCLAHDRQARRREGASENRLRRPVQRPFHRRDRTRRRWWPRCLPGRLHGRRR
jgi:2-methylcitrate dehydratase PrpD